MARNANRIRPIIELVCAFWMIYPDLRFFQMVEVLQSELCRYLPQFKEVNGSDLFHLEDDVLYETINQLLHDMKAGTRP